MKTVQTVMVVALVALLVAACGAQQGSTGAATGAPAAGQTTALRIGASPVPHADILKYVQQNLAGREGLTLEIVEFTDYVQPNVALNDGQIDANFFQHIPYMEEFAKERNMPLAAVASVHVEAFGIYSRKVSGLSDLPDGAVVAIPNDPTNGGRALQLLAANKLLTLKEGAGTSATTRDILDNPKNLQITELEAAQLPRSLDDVTLAVINGNYAIEAGLTPSADALALESGANNPYANVLAVLDGKQNDPNIQKLVRLLNSPEVKQFIQDTYKGSVVPAF